MGAKVHFITFDEAYNNGKMSKGRLVIRILRVTASAPKMGKKIF
jgi:hypothetical protein